MVVKGEEGKREVVLVKGEEGKREVGGGDWQNDWFWGEMMEERRVSMRTLLKCDVERAGTEPLSYTMP